jgi:hypothetical protein
MNLTRCAPGHRGQCYRALSGLGRAPLVFPGLRPGLCYCAPSGLKPASPLTSPPVSSRKCGTRPAHLRREAFRNSPPDSGGAGAEAPGVVTGGISGWSPERLGAVTGARPQSEVNRLVTGRLTATAHGRRGGSNARQKENVKLAHRAADRRSGGVPGKRRGGRTTEQGPNTLGPPYGHATACPNVAWPSWPCRLGKMPMPRVPPGGRKAQHPGSPPDSGGGARPRTDRGGVLSWRGPTWPGHPGHAPGQDAYATSSAGRSGAYSQLPS